MPEGVQPQEKVRAPAEGKRLPWDTLRGRLLFVLALTNLPLIALTLGLAIERAEYDRVQAERALRTEVRLASGSIREVIEGIRQLLFSVASTPELRSKDGARCSAYFRNMQPRLVEMLDDFHDGCRVESAQSAIAVHQRTMQQTDPFALLRREPIEREARLGQIEYPARHIHADDLRELVIAEEPAQELSLAASQIEHARGAGILQRGEHGVEATLVEADRLLDRRLLLVLPG